MGLESGNNVGRGHLLDYISKYKKKRENTNLFFVGGVGVGGFCGGAWGMVWVESVVVCQVSVDLSKYESNVILNKEVMAI